MSDDTVARRFAIYLYLDTSALVKRYDPLEPKSAANS
jgi:hypothetical protein